MIPLKRDTESSQNDRKYNDGWQRHGEVAIESYYLMGRVFQFYKMKRTMEILGGDGWTIL